ncbi:MAG: YdiU family protein [Rhodospirillaceae bacterium]|nr:YdiU family protein [Rhodospirillaceae bacterium]
MCNHSDPTGRYALTKQPAVAYWNLQVLGYVLQSLIPEQMARDILATFPTEYNSFYQELMTAKFGITKPNAHDQEIWIKLLDLMAKHKADYTKVFHILSGVVAGQDNKVFKALFQDKALVQDWLSLYLNRMRQEAPGYRARIKK